MNRFRDNLLSHLATTILACAWPAIAAWKAMVDGDNP
jgi:hypothetical protein